MRTLNVNNFFAPPLLNALVAVGYIAAVAILIYAIGVHVQLDAQRTLQYTPASGSAPPVTAGPCADSTGIERGLCKADAKIDATKAKIKRHLEKRRLQEANVVMESLPEQPYPALVFVRDTLVWAAERADFQQPVRASIQNGPQHLDGSAPPSTSSLRAVTTARPFARH